MAKASISKRVVDASEPGPKPYFVWDEKLSGFGLKVTPAGGKTYVYQYRVADPGKVRETTPARYTIGKHGNLTPDQARKRAQELAAMVEAGIDPREAEADKRKAKEEAKRKAQEKARLETDLAFSRMADLWLTAYEHELGRRPSSIRQAKLVVENHLKPTLSDKPMPHIGRADLQPILDSIPVVQKAMRRTVFAYASILFGWATKRGDIPRNPLVDMAKPQAPKARDRVLTDDELVEVWNAVGQLADPWGPFYRLAILTGQRREEVAALRWAELDRATKEWTIPAERTKNGVAHIVPLSEVVVMELDGIAGGVWPRAGYVLTTTGRTPISGLSKAKRALDAKVVELRQKAAGDGVEVEAMPAWRLHDLRRTVATGFQRLGVRFEVTEAALNHVSGAKGGVAGIYQRHDWKDEKRAALDAWAHHLQAIVHPAETDNVVRLHG